MLYVRVRYGVQSCLHVLVCYMYSCVNIVCAYLLVFHAFLFVVVMSAFNASLVCFNIVRMHSLPTGLCFIRSVEL